VRDGGVKPCYNRGPPSPVSLFINVGDTQGGRGSEGVKKARAGQKAVPRLSPPLPLSLQPPAAPPSTTTPLSAELDEADVLGVLAEALAAHVEAVLADEAPTERGEERERKNGSDQGRRFRGAARAGAWRLPIPSHRTLSTQILTDCRTPGRTGRPCRCRCCGSRRRRSDPFFLSF
jgi:hypothetical protein